MNQKELETVVIAECNEHLEKNSGNFGFQACVHIGTEYFVKYGISRHLEPERSTQEYIFAHAQQVNMPNTPRIPRIIHHFVDQHTAYLVMEHIKLQESPPDLPERILEAVKWLSEVPLPPNHTLGPVGGGPIRHSFFKNFTAPFLIPDVEMLDRYMAKAYLLLSVAGRQYASPVSVRGERLMFTQSYMKGSFGVDEHGRTVLMNFYDIGLLPETFVNFTLGCARTASLGWPPNSQVASLARIAHCLGMAANPTFGMTSKYKKRRREQRLRRVLS